MTEDDAREDARPITIKALPNAAREALIACAKRRGQTQGEWLADVILAAARIQSGDRIEFPDMVQQAVPIAPGSVAAIVTAELRELMDAVATAQAATGATPPKKLARHAYALVEQRLRQARGLPALAVRQTSRKIGMTIDHGED